MMQTSLCFRVAAALAALAPLAASAQVRKPAAPKAAVKIAPANPVAKPAAKPAPAATVAATPVAAPSPTPAAQPTKTTRATAKTDVPATFGTGTSALNLGVGLGSRYSYGAGLFGGSSSSTPALSLSYEHGVAALGPGYLGVGGIVGYQGASYDLGLGDKWRYHDVVVMARGSFHYAFVPKLDTYAGLGLGVRYLRSSLDDGTVSASATDLASGLFLGARYYFTPGIGAFAELGYDQSFLKVGLSAKF